jgi:hypothetical protein
MAYVFFSKIIKDSKFSECISEVNSELLTSRNFNCNLFRLEGQHQLGAGVYKKLLIHNLA